ncbi:hypothetical protein HYDPIDRAFT_28672 [Hydnomerulius pinastri MD-312]|uniref:Uncharacterized protein n=1 Tax=Hydnomerulius pinastri MD-312 TaxID=994086 RepID=A0A0C9W0F9_9AGAM|nr:hypothetical protein HYDPIDRAFT_28672 [Hydnomerulius pinastri MD-312]
MYILFLDLRCMLLALSGDSKYQGEAHSTKSERSVIAKHLISKIASTRYIFLSSGLVFILWSSIIAVVSKPFRTLAHVETNPEQNITAHTNISLVTGPSIINDTDEFLNTSVSKYLRQLRIASQVYMVSLPQRQDRREQMEFLSTIQGLAWTVLDAIPSTDPSVNHILDWVVKEREQLAERLETTIDASSNFPWPREIGAWSVEQGSLEGSGSDSWARKGPPSTKSKNPPTPVTRPNLTCAAKDRSIPALMDKTLDCCPPAKIACWYSHVPSIRQFGIERMRKSTT